MKRFVFSIALLGLAACTSPSLPGFNSTEADAALDAALTVDGPQRPQPRPMGLDTSPPPPPPASARTVEEFDTTSAEERAAAVAVPPVQDAQGERRLGTTIASLGSPADPGIWFKTPLVSEVTQGRVEYPVNGKSVNVELRPSGGAPGSGSQISLAAMRLLEAPLTGLPELVVFAY